MTPEQRQRFIRPTAPTYHVREISFDDEAFDRLKQHQRLLECNTGRRWTNSQALNHLLKHLRYATATELQPTNG